MGRIKQIIGPNGFYVTFFFIICLYGVFLRLKAFPSVLSYALYLFCIIFSLGKLLKSGASMKWGGDVFVIFLFLLFYFFSGLLFISSEAQESVSWIFKDYLYSLLPVLFYVVVRISRYQINSNSLLISSWLSIVITDLIALVLLINPRYFSFFDQRLIEHEGLAFVLHGLGGVIQIGFLNVIGFAICLLSGIRLNKAIIVVSAILFVICVFLTGQRTPLGGLLIVLILFLLRYKIKAVFPIIAIVIAFIFFLPRLSRMEIQDVPILETMSDRMINRFSYLEEGETGRNDQYKIYHDGSICEFLLGDGVGKHSPENIYSSSPLPDAMLFRIFNEMGLLGLSLYILFFLLNFVRAIRTKDVFAFALVTYFFFANCFNRVLFNAPMSILPFVLMAFFNWNMISKRLTQNDTGAS